MIMANPRRSMGEKCAPRNATDVTVAMTGSMVPSMAPRTEPTSFTPCR